MKFELIGYLREVNFRKDKMKATPYYDSIKLKIGEVKFETASEIPEIMSRIHRVKITIEEEV